ncbi:nucleotidyltransferase domain-containing protein [Thermodesulfovibrio sp. TK110]
MKNDSSKINSLLIQEIVKRILSVISPDKIIFFGSYIYGKPHLDSDIDIIVIKSDIKSKIEEYRKIRKSLKGLKYPFDIIVISPEEFNFYSLRWQNSVIAEANEKGKIVYERNS